MSDRPHGSERITTKESIVVIATVIAVFGCDRGASVVGSRTRIRRTPLVSVTVEGRFEILRDRLGATSSTVVLGDCDDDGHLDAVTTGAAPHHQPPDNIRAAPRLWRALGGGDFRPDTDAGLAPDPSSTGVFTDLDGDGVLDLVLAGPGVYAYRGLGQCRFGPPRSVDPSPGAEFLRVLGLHVADIDLDGLSDLVLTRHGLIDVPFRMLIAQGDGSYRPTDLHAQSLMAAPEGYAPYGLFVHDIDGDGYRDVFAMVDRQQSWFAWGGPNGVMYATRDVNLSVVFAGSNPMSALSFDYDRDGVLDYFFSGVQGRSLLLHHEGRRSLVDQGYDAEVNGMTPNFAWGAATFDANLDGWDDLLVLREDESHDPNHVQAPTEIYINRGDGSFAEMGPGLLGVSLEAKGMTCGDLDADGRVACVAFDRRNPVVLRNGIRPRGGWVGVRLRGTVGSPDANGALISVVDAARPSLHYYGGQVPYATEHSRELILATGDQAALRLRVEWPSGVVQFTEPLPGGAYTTVIEPQVVQLSSRVAPADGVSEVRIEAFPTRGGAAEVEFELLGSGTWVGSPERGPDGSVSRRLQAPTAPGESRVRVLLDGVPLHTQPCVRFIMPARAP